MVLVPSVGQVSCKRSQAVCSTWDLEHLRINEGNFKICNMSTQLGRKEVVITLR